MKKEYQKPQAEIIHFKTEEILKDSIVVLPEHEIDP